tara:strand:+ start:69 stop:725 length:657 start_codon:yes stop_codon:yes gene_type:complete
MQQIISLIPAKGKSKRLKNKNLKKYKGKTLISISISASLKSKMISKTFVSSDSELILKIADKMKAYPLKRNKNLAKDSTSAEDLIKNFIKKISKKYSKNTVLVYLQPTSPKRNFKHIDEAIKIFLKEKKPLVSVYKAKDKNIAKSYFFKKKKLFAMREDFVNKNDQQIPQVYFQNGAIYIFTIKSFLKNRSIPKTNVIPYFMSESDSLDINYKSDLKK